VPPTITGASPLTSSYVDRAATDAGTKRNTPLCLQRTCLSPLQLKIWASSVHQRWTSFRSWAAEFIPSLVMSGRVHTYFSTSFQFGAFVRYSDSPYTGRIAIQHSCFPLVFNPEHLYYVLHCIVYKFFNVAWVKTSRSTWEKQKTINVQGKTN